MAGAGREAGASEGFDDAEAEAEPGLSLSADAVEDAAAEVADGDPVDADPAPGPDPPGFAPLADAPLGEVALAEADAGEEAGLAPDPEVAGLPGDPAPVDAGRDAPDVEAPDVEAPAGDDAGFDAGAEDAPGRASAGFVSAGFVSGVFVSPGFDAGDVADAAGPPVAGFCAADLAPGTSLASRSIVTGLRPEPVPDAGPEPGLDEVFAESLFWSGFLLSAAMTVLSPAGPGPCVCPCNMRFAVEPVAPMIAVFALQNKYVCRLACLFQQGDQRRLARLGRDMAGPEPAQRLRHLLRQREEHEPSANVERSQRRDQRLGRAAGVDQHR